MVSGVIEGGEMAWAAMTWCVGIASSSGCLSLAVMWCSGLISSGDGRYVQVDGGDVAVVTVGLRKLMVVMWRQ